MNKKIPALMALVLALTAAVSVSAAETAPDVTGEWYAGMYGIPVTLSLQEDSFSLEVLGETIDGTWEMTDDGILLSDDAGVLSLDGDTLTLEEEDVQVVFTREPVETFAPGSVRMDAQEADFAGTWNSTYVNYLGMVMNGAEAGLDMAAVIDGTNVTLRSESMGLEDKVIPCTYEDGSLKLALQQEEAAAEETAEETETAAEASGLPGMEMTVSLLDNDILSMDMQVYGLEVTFYMEKTAEPAVEETSEAAVEETTEAAEEPAA